jgi:hypothetical protein
MTHSLTYQGMPVEVYVCGDGDWQRDTVFLYNSQKVITKVEIRSIIQYLYDEGYIKDRRTRYMIADGNTYEI